MKAIHGMVDVVSLILLIMGLMVFRLLQRVLRSWLWYVFDRLDNIRKEVLGLVNSANEVDLMIELLMV